MKKEGYNIIAITSDIDWAPEAVIALVEGLYAIIIEQLKRITELEERVRTLERQLGKTSRNSSKPPSTDQVKVKRRIHSLREKSDRPVGGQIGHEGHTLERVSNPDHTVLHQVDQCSSCGKSLEQVPPIDCERRQVFDLPPMKIEVTEHQSEKKICPRCGCLNQALFPNGVGQAAQYGSRLRSLAVYLNQYQFIPYDRLSELFADLLRHDISQATLVEANRECYELVEPSEKATKKELIMSDVVGFDKVRSREGRLSLLRQPFKSGIALYSIGSALAGIASYGGRGSYAELLQLVIN